MPLISFRCNPQTPTCHILPVLSGFALYRIEFDRNPHIHPNLRSGILSGISAHLLIPHRLLWGGVRLPTGKCVFEFPTLLFPPGRLSLFAIDRFLPRNSWYPWMRSGPPLILTPLHPLVMGLRNLPNFIPRADFQIGKSSRRGRIVVNRARSRNSGYPH